MIATDMPQSGIAMSALQNNTEFQADYEKLRDVSLNPSASRRGECA